MLDLRPCCEHCGRDLPPESGEAMICTFECTFCAACAVEVLDGVCPNCTGDFVPRPIRPPAALLVHPATTEWLHRPVDLDRHRRRVADHAAELPRNTVRR